MSAARAHHRVGTARAHAVVFDLDGTLVDTEPAYRDAFVAAAAALGAHVTAAFHERLVGLASRDRTPLLLAEFGPAFPIARFFADYRRRKAAVLDCAIPLRPGALALVAGLRGQGIACALATSATRRTAEAILDRTGLRGYFGTVVTRDDVERGKPDPQTHLLAATRIGHDPAQCLALEDSGPGLLAASAAGMIPVAAGSAPPPAHVAVLCAAVVSTFADLHPYLPQWQLRGQ